MLLEEDFNLLVSNPVVGWQDLTSSFYSRPEDSYSCLDLTGSRLTPPFCTASCNSKCIAFVDGTCSDYFEQPIR